MKLPESMPGALSFRASPGIATTPHSDQDVSLQTRYGCLAGSLRVPLQQAQNAPVVLIIAGSGPTDRDGNSPAGVQASSYRLIAESLAARGIASLRYDKLFSGASQSRTISEQDMRFEDYANDAAGWLEYLKNDPRFKRFLVLGHSEGSLVAMLAAQQSAVDGLISIAGAGRNIADTLLDQLWRQLTPALFAQCQRVISALRAGHRVAASSTGLPNEVSAALFRENAQPYLISWMKYDPAKEIGKLKTRVLVVHGEADLQVPVADAERLAAAASVEPVVLPEVNHILKTAPLQPEANIATYGNPDLPLAPGVIEALVNFINSSK